MEKQWNHITLFLIKINNFQYLCQLHFSQKRRREIYVETRKYHRKRRTRS